MKRSIASKPKSTAISTLLWHRLQEGGFIVFSALAIFLLVALMTYQEADPGWSHTATQQEIRNAAGKAGAWLADVGLYLFGYIAYMFPLMIGYGGFRLFQTRFQIEDFHRLFWAVRVVGFVLSVISGCGLASLHFTKSAKMPVSAGGIFGQVVQAELSPVLGHLGSTLGLLAVFLASITVATGLSWFGLMDVLGKQLAEKLRTICFADFLVWIKKMLALRQNNKPSERILPSFTTQPKERVKKEPLIQIDPFPTPRLIENKMVKEVKKIPSKSSLISPSSNALNSELPSVNLLNAAVHPDDKKTKYSAAKLEALSREVEARLLEFGIQVNVVAVYPGPVITRFELELAPGIKVSRISGLAKDLARALSVNRVRVVEVIPGKSVIGLEIPNEYRELVCLREILESSQYLEAASHLTLALGKDISGNPIVVNLSKMPHLLVAGTTGSGKSVGINAMLLSLLYKATPTDVRLILIDPKMLELSVYDSIPHLLTPVVTDMKDAANALRWCVGEMERRYQLMAALGVRNLVGYNHKIAEAEQAKKPLLDPLWPAEAEGERPQLTRLPYIIVIIDEFADMIMVVGKKVEELIARIAQKARAAGIHLILATQRPSVDVITGLIKANVPTRIAFQVSSRIDSRTILDQQGAEQLLGHGDMLYLAPGEGIPIRIHGAFVSDEEVHAVVKALKQLGTPDYAIDILSSHPLTGSGKDEEGGDEQDELYDSAVQIVLETRRASISLLQRRLKIGYNRAARLIETMEEAGMVSPMQSNGGREILVGQSYQE